MYRFTFYPSIGSVERKRENKFLLTSSRFNIEQNIPKIFSVSHLLYVVLLTKACQKSMNQIILKVLVVYFSKKKLKNTRD